MQILAHVPPLQGNEMRWNGNTKSEMNTLKRQLWPSGQAKKRSESAISSLIQARLHSKPYFTPLAYMPHGYLTGAADPAFLRRMRHRHR